MVKEKVELDYENVPQMAHVAGFLDGLLEGATLQVESVQRLLHDIDGKERLSMQQRACIKTTLKDLDGLLDALGNRHNRVKGE